MIFVYTLSLWHNRISYEGSFWLGKETLEMTRKRRKKDPSDLSATEEETIWQV